MQRAHPDHSMIIAWKLLGGVGAGLLLALMIAAPDPETHLIAVATATVALGLSMSWWVAAYLSTPKAAKDGGAQEDLR